MPSAPRPTAWMASPASTTPACASCTPRARSGRWRWASDHLRSDGQSDRRSRSAGDWRWSPVNNHDAWVLALVIGLVAALIVAGLLIALVQAVRSIEGSVSSLLEVAGKVGANTANIPQLLATAPVLGLIVEEAVVQDGYMNALTDGYGGK